jgi:hypothetical protein
VWIVEEEPDGVGDGAGLRRGTLIPEVDRLKVKTVDEARRAFAKAPREKGVLLQVRAPHGGTTYVLLQALASR